MPFECLKPKNLELNSPFVGTSVSVAEFFNGMRKDVQVKHWWQNHLVLKEERNLDKCNE